MTVDLPLRVTELLASRICHDLISPVSAINNGVELVEELGPDGLHDALDLIGQSAKSAARKLMFLRLAYGAAGSEAGLGWRDLKEAANAFFEGGKVTIQWQDDSYEFKTGEPKLVLNMALVAQECLPHGGTVAIFAGQDGTLRVTASGAVMLRPEIAEALTGAMAMDALGPRNIHAFLTASFTRAVGRTLRTETPAPETLVLSA
jgi:histidine phosphotransferase ChpT